MRIRLVNLLVGHTRPIISLLWCPCNPHWILAVGSDGVLVVWDVLLGERKFSTKLRSAPVVAAWSRFPDSRVVYIGLKTGR